jgi:hypothetical protein
VAEKSKQMLERNWIAAIYEIPEQRRNVALPLCEKQSDACAKYWQSRNQKDTHDCNCSRHQTKI